MTTNQTERVSDEELDQMIWKLERDGMTPKMLSLMRELREVRRAKGEPVAWDYEWASCITCEGPQDFKRIIEHEAPPEWAIEEGQARNVIPLYTAPPAPVVPDLKELEAILDWILMLPCPTPKATHFAMRLAVVIEACRAAMHSDGILTNEGTRQTDELVMWVKRLAHSLRKANPDSKLQSEAMGYLSRKGLVGVEDILR